VGPGASLGELDERRAKLVADPANYISQPCINLSVRRPWSTAGSSRHVDLRPFAVTGSSTWVIARRADASGVASRLAGRQFLAGRRFEGHVDS
jgi:uncharacterized circularly permuted ATP-grasp superfamily protein